MIWDIIDVGEIVGISTDSRGSIRVLEVLGFGLSLNIECKTVTLVRL
jgi:hypothetical protein